MMRKTSMIRARTDPALKSEVDRILEELGLTVSEAINLFFKQVLLRRGLPFEVALPNKVTLGTFNKTDKNQDLVECKDAEDLFNKLGL